MAIDKNLFLYDLAVVAIMKNEAPYVKEWLDYHLLAGVDHFYIYDNESTDDYNKIIQPYVEKGLVTSVYYPGKGRQIVAYNDAVHKYRFFCRYMAFIDGDEFVFPKSRPTISEVVDEIFSNVPNAGSLEISWQMFGSNGEEKADYSRGVLERFKRRAENNASSNPATKNIIDPRKARILDSPHTTRLFENYFPINETGAIQTLPWQISPPLTEKIVVNHYHVKSFEEYLAKIAKGSVFYLTSEQAGYKKENFRRADRNEVFDDGILKYRTARQLEMGGGTDVLESLAPQKQINYLRLSNALVQNLFPATLRNPPPDFFAGKMETFLTCRKLAAFLRENLLDKDFGMALEEAALRAIRKTFTTNLTLSDLRLLIDEMPEILTLKYPVVNEIRETLIQILPRMMDIFRTQNAWREFRELEIFMNTLKAFDFYEHD